MFKRTFLQQNKDASQRRMHRIFTVSSPLCNTVSGASSWRPGGWHTTEERWLETPHPSQVCRAEDGWQREAAVQYSTAQYSTVQCSTGMRTRYNAGLAGNDWWPALTPAWFKLKTADWGSDNQCYLQLIPRLLASDTNMTQPAPHTFHLHLFASCATSYMHTTEITYFWVFLRKDKPPTIKRTTHNLHLLFIFI